MRLALFVALLALAGCTDPVTQQPDQCLRATLFDRCMSLLPAGPSATKYNDWDEVIEACRAQAYYTSLRNTAHIKPECLPL